MAREPVGHWTDLTPVPTNVFPELRVVYGRLRGQHSETVKTAYAAAILIAYGIAQMPHDHPEPHPMFTDEHYQCEPDGSCPELADDLAEECPELDQPQQVGSDAVGLSLPASFWTQLAATLLPLVMEWLSRRD